MILYILGIITGLILATLVIILGLKNQKAIQRSISQMESKLKTKGSLADPEPDDFTNWISELPQE